MNSRKNLKSTSLLLFGICLIIIGLLIISYKKVEVIQIKPSPVSVSTSTPSATFAKVTRVIDGDTIVIDSGQKVRYIGMNTPEVEISECFATEASEINKNLVLGNEIKLVKDISETDKYGRLLRYVYVKDENNVGDLFVNDELVKNGSARVETVKPDLKYESEFVTSEKFAKVNHLGLWEKCF